MYVHMYLQTTSNATKREIENMIIGTKSLIITRANHAMNPKHLST